MGTLFFNGIANAIDDDALVPLFGTMMKMINEGRSGVIFTYDLSETTSWYVHPGILLHATYDTPLGVDHEQVIRGRFTTDDDGHPVPAQPTH